MAGSAAAVTIAYGRSGMVMPPLVVPLPATVWPKNTRTLASGRLRCIGSTTFQEYRQHFEKDRALVRRFQRVEVNEPSVEDTVKILEGLRKQYEEFHGVRSPEEALQAAAELGAKYLHDRKLPASSIRSIALSGRKRSEM